MGANKKANGMPVTASCLLESTKFTCGKRLARLSEKSFGQID
jgi:hypothetical protein